MLFPILNLCILFVAAVVGYAVYRSQKLAELEHIARLWDGMRLGRLAESIDVDKPLLPVDDDPLGLKEHKFFSDGQGPELLRDIITKREDDAVGEFWIAYQEDAPEVSGGGETEREAFLDVMKKIERLPQPDYEEIQAVYPEWKPGQ